MLRRVHRFGGGIAAVADAVRRGDADATVAALSAGHDDVTWIPLGLAEPSAAAGGGDGRGGATAGGGDGRGDHATGAPGRGRAPAGLAAVRDAAVATGSAIAEAARAGDARAALEALGGFRLLCAHRRGPYGVATWSAQVEAWLASAVPGFAASGTWYVGRPLLVTEKRQEAQVTVGRANSSEGRSMAPSPVIFQFTNSTVSPTRYAYP